MEIKKEPLPNLIRAALLCGEENHTTAGRRKATQPRGKWKTDKTIQPAKLWEGLKPYYLANAREKTIQTSRKVQY